MEKKILLVEDSQTQALQLQYILEQYEYKVTIAPSAEGAFELVKKQKPSIIISDVIMPGMDGYELCRRIKSDEDLKDIKVILLTTLSTPEDIIKGLVCGADNFITKPFKVDFLISRLDYIIKSHKVEDYETDKAGIEILFDGKKHVITSERRQVLDLLFSTFEHGLQKKNEAEELSQELRKAREIIKTLRGLIPVCGYCKKIRDDDAYWQQVNAYIQEHGESEFSHSLCPECLHGLYSDYT